MSCILRVYGADLAVDELARSTSIVPYKTFRKGEPGVTRSRAPLEKSGAYILVSDRDFGDIPAQIADAVAFLEANEAAVRQILAFPGVDGARLDFGAEWRDVAVQGDIFPARLLLLAGRLGLDLKVTHYPTPDPATAEGAGA